MSIKVYKRYTAQFKRVAIRLAEESGKRVTEEAREPGLRVNQIYRRKQQPEAKGDAAFPGHGMQAGLEAENARLRRDGRFATLCPHNARAFRRRSKKVRWADVEIRYFPPVEPVHLEEAA